MVSKQDGMQPEKERAESATKVLCRLMSGLLCGLPATRACEIPENPALSLMPALGYIWPVL